MNILLEKLRFLRLPGVSQSLDARHQYALANKVSYLDFLELLLEDEYSNRLAKAYRNRLTRSKLSEQKTLENYDFSYQPELDQQLINELASCRYMEERKNLVLMGPPGVGKTHLANALGLKALFADKKVLFLHAHHLIEKLIGAKADGSYQRLLYNLTKTDLLIIDELGFRKVPTTGLDDFFEVIRRKYEQSSIIITSNRSFEDWGPIFGDKTIASAIIDRIVHHSVIIKITGNSYRVKHFINPDAIQPTTRARGEKEAMKGAKEQMEQREIKSSN